MRWIWWVLGLLAFPVPAAGQRVAAVETWKCSFPRVSTNDWKASDGKYETEAQKFELYIDAVNLTKGTARIIGNVGGGDLIAFKGDSAVHFLEQTRSGNLIVTTVFDAPTGRQPFKAVHSRHMYLPGGPMVSQAFGWCVTNWLP